MPCTGCASRLSSAREDHPQAAPLARATVRAVDHLLRAFSWRALQILGLHEGRDASPVIAKLAQIHKDQIVEDRPSAPRPAPPPASAAPKPAVEKVAPHRSQLLVIWFLLMAVGLLASTSLGIYMAFAYKRDRVVILSLLAAGTAIPVIGLFV